MDVTTEVNLYAMYERRQLEAQRPRSVLPVTIITGFLGAGKTTLLRSILRSKDRSYPLYVSEQSSIAVGDPKIQVCRRAHILTSVLVMTGSHFPRLQKDLAKQNLRIAAVVNEYGSVDHDGSVVEHDGLTDTVGKLAGGCICCQGSLGDELEDKVGELLRKPDHAEERCDYLVIETSGVSDPETIIRALDKTFGKLTRARLDSVVAVVDSDFLFHSLQDNSSMPVSLRRQLKNADVVLLNKADLLNTKQQLELSSHVSAVNASARIKSCSYGQVPLQEVLDVGAPRTDIQGVSHERVERHLYVSSSGGNLRTTSSANVSTHTPSSCSGDNQASSTKPSNDHLREDGFDQVTFTTQSPLSLARFQDWVSCGMPAGAIRIKGALAFDEDKLTRSVFNMSGRRRLSFETDGRWEGPLRVYLVVIGVGINKDDILSTLEEMCVPKLNLGLVKAAPSRASDGEVDGVEDERTRLEHVLESDPLFERIGVEAKPLCADNVIRFRFTGRGAYGIPPSQLSIKFGVNLNMVNRAILRAVNGGAAAQEGALVDGARNASEGTDQRTSPRVFLTSEEGICVSDMAGEENCVVLRYALGGRISLTDVWGMIIKDTRGVMARELGHVHFCSCFS